MRLVIVVICCIVTLAFAERAFGQDYIQSYENGVDRPGSDIGSFVPDSPNPEICARACVNNPNCTAFTYVHPANGYPAACWLKAPAPAAVANACCISGLVMHMAPADGGAPSNPSQPQVQPAPPSNQPVPPESDSADLGDIATPEGASAVRDCFAYWQGEERAKCLTAAAVTHFDEAICAYDPTYQCHRLAAEGLMDRCRTLSQENRELCFSTVAVEWREPDSCARADNTQYCVALIAIETRNPQLIHQRLGNDPSFDLFAAMYAASTGDASVIGWISNGDRADMTQIMTIAAAAARGQPLPDSMCYSWRGDGSEGLMPEGDYTAEATQFCLRARAQAEALRAVAANMSEEELLELLKEFESALARGDDPDLAMQRLIGQAAAPAPPAPVGNANPTPSAPNAVINAEPVPLNTPGMGGTGLLGQGE